MTGVSSMGLGEMSVVAWTVKAPLRRGSGDMAAAACRKRWSSGNHWLRSPLALPRTRRRYGAHTARRSAHLTVLAAGTPSVGRAALFAGGVAAAITAAFALTPDGKRAWTDAVRQQDEPPGIPSPWSIFKPPGGDSRSQRVFFGISLISFVLERLCFPGAAAITNLVWMVLMTRQLSAALNSTNLPMPGTGVPTGPPRPPVPTPSANMFHSRFPALAREPLLHDMPCMLTEEELPEGPASIPGQLYVTAQHICFYGTLGSKQLTIPFEAVASLERPEAKASYLNAATVQLRNAVPGSMSTKLVLTGTSWLSKTSPYDVLHPLWSKATSIAS
eukprot:jgi/Chlat1/3108/Chrsp21S03348